jgi:hypothetical protein
VELIGDRARVGQGEISERGTDGEARGRASSRYARMSVAVGSRQVQKFRLVPECKLQEWYVGRSDLSRAN